MEKLCWWCETNRANSGEHIFKKTDIKRVYGNSNLGAKIHYDSSVRNVQGANSKYLKFKKSICSKCNGSSSSSFDRAYDKFIDSVRPSYKRYASSPVINFSEIYGMNWKSEFQNLLKYFVKHIGCYLSQVELEVPDTLRNFLNGGKYPSNLKYNFEIRPLNYGLKCYSIDKMKTYYEAMDVGELECLSINERRYLFSWYTIDWISFNWVISDNLKIKFLPNEFLKLEIANNTLPSDINVKNIYEVQRVYERYDRNMNDLIKEQYLAKTIES